MVIAKTSLSAKAALSTQLFKLPQFSSARDHSKHIDRQLGFKIARIESKLARTYKHFSFEENGPDKFPYQENREGWIGLDPQVLLTPYSEIAQIFETLKKHDIKTIVDFGCAYGRVGLVSSTYFKDSTFIGYELVGKRLKEARRIFERHELNKFELVECDILSEHFRIPKACVYFIYDFGRIGDLKNILTKIIALMPNENFIMVARGEEIQSLVLNFFPEFKKTNIQQEKNYLIYKNEFNRHRVL